MKGIGPKAAQQLWNAWNAESVQTLQSNKQRPEELKASNGAAQDTRTRRAASHEAPRTLPSTKASPDTADAEQTLTAALKELVDARSTYYAGTPTMSDEVYDALLVDLRSQLAALKARLATSATSPTARRSQKGAAKQQNVIDEAEAFLNAVGAAPSALPAAADAQGKPKRRRSIKKAAQPQTARVIAQVEHTAARGGRLLSLAAVHSEEELRTWWRRHVTDVLGSDQDASIVVEPKVDGLTLRLSYENGELVEV